MLRKPLLTGALRVINKAQSILARTASLDREQAQNRVFLRSGQRPWSPGYAEHKMRTLRQTLGDPAILEKFQSLKPLPDGYAWRLDARLVEIPWVLSRVAGNPAEMLDAGSALNHLPVLEADALRNVRLTVLTLAPEKNCYWNKGISYVYDDLRDVPFRDNRFDIIACISTIEHVGMDNSLYTGDSEAARPGASTDFLVAVAELKRVLKPGGVLYITLPFGRYENHGWLQQFDTALADKLIQGFDPSSMTEAIYRYTAGGWVLSDRASCAECEYFDVHTSKYFDPASTIDFPEDYAPGERAVACLELHKPGGKR